MLINTLVKQARKKEKTIGNDMNNFHKKRKQTKGNGMTKNSTKREREREDGG